VENARIYSLPERPPPLLVAGAGKKSAELAGRIGDGFVGTAPEASSVQAFEQAGGAGKPRIGHATVCWAADEASARRTALEIWPNIAIPGQLGQELALPSDFEQVASLVTEDAVAELVACGPDPEAHLALIDKFAKAGYDHVYVHQIGPDQTGFLRFYEREILPKVA
jgi:G6PDH family F420-dependent oxidoreductase